MQFHATMRMRFIQACQANTAPVAVMVALEEWLDLVFVNRRSVVRFYSPAPVFADLASSSGFFWSWLRMVADSSSLFGFSTKLIQPNDRLTVASRNIM